MTVNPVWTNLRMCLNLIVSQAVDTVQYKRSIMKEPLPNMFRKSLRFVPYRTQVNIPCPYRKGSTWITKTCRKRHTVFLLKGVKFGVLKPILNYKHILKCFLHMCNLVGAMRSWYIYSDMLDKTTVAWHVTFLYRGKGTEVMRFVEIALKSVILVRRGNLTGWWKLFSELCHKVAKLRITIALHFEILTESYGVHVE